MNKLTKSLWMVLVKKHTRWMEWRILEIPRFTRKAISVGTGVPDGPPDRHNTLKCKQHTTHTTHTMFSIIIFTLISVKSFTVFIVLLYYKPSEPLWIGRFRAIQSPYNVPYNKDFVCYIISMKSSVSSSIFFHHRWLPYSLNCFRSFCLTQSPYPHKKIIPTDSAE